MERHRHTEKPYTGKTFAEVKDIKDRHTDELMSNPIVIGVGIGKEEAEESQYFIIRGYLREKPQQENLPGVLEEVPVRYTTTGEFVAL